MIATIPSRWARVTAALATHGDARIHHITVCNEARLNVLDSGLLCELGHALGCAAEDRDARAVVLHGAGERAWIGGADIGEMATLDTETARGFIVLLHQVCRAIVEHRLPIIAAIDGYCLGGGLEIAASCDLRLASTQSRFGMPEVRVGIPSVIDAARLPALVGAGRARDLVMTGRLIDAATADRWGLVETVAAGQALDALLIERLDELLAAGPAALAAQKRLCAQWESEPLEHAIAASIDAFTQAFEGDEPARYMRRFLDRARS